MRYLAFAMLLALALLASVPALGKQQAAAPAEDRLDAAVLLRNWDRLRYYNREMGLKDFQADVSCDLYNSLLVTTLGKSSFRLLWEWPGTAHIILSAGPGSTDTVREVARAIEGQMAQLILKSLTDTAAAYEIRILLEQADAAGTARRNVLSGTRLDVNNPVQSFRTMLSAQGLEESTDYNTDTGRYRRVIDKAVTEDGRQLVTDMTLEIYNDNRDPTTATVVKKRIHWEYTKVGKFYLPSLMRVEYPDKVPMTFTLSNFKVNTGGKTK